MPATAKAQPNIALIKYWGKRDSERNLPAVGSTSITLADLHTTMCVDFDESLTSDCLAVNGEQRPAMLERVSRCLDSVAGRNRPAASVTSESNFPIAAGLASSASAFAALVVAADAAAGTGHDRERLANLAGRASGSAARSLLGGFVELRNEGDGIGLRQLRTVDEWPLSVVVAVTASGPKPIGSSAAMETHRKASPFYERWVAQQDEDLEEARQAIADRDLQRLGSIAEHNCLKMHSVMWASRPPTVYWNSTTLECMEAVRNLQDAGVGVFFTIDAGPQVKAICEPADAAAVLQTFESIDGLERVLTTGLGEGARIITGD